MPKEIINDPSEGDLVWLKYTFRFGDKFDEPNDDWLKCIEVTSDELLGSYSKAKDNALSAAFGSRVSAFRTRGVPGPTSKLSSRAPAQMGRRETEREGGKEPEGDGRDRWNPAAFVFVPCPGRVRLQ
jgi:hypothetical protein